MGKASKGKRATGVLLFLLIVVFIVLAVFLGGLLYTESARRKKTPVYRQVSMSEEAAARAYIWLDRIEDMPLSYADIRELMGDISFEIVLTPTEEPGIYTQTVVDGSYEYCEYLARSGFEKAYREVARHRFAAAGYEGEVSDNMLDDLMREAYGVSVSEYLASCEVQLLTPFEELEKTYSGEVTYE